MTSYYGTSVPDVAPLAEPLTFTFSGKTARNRFEKSAMSERMASWFPQNKGQSGIPSDRLINLYRIWGCDGNLGLIVTGTISVDPGYMESPGNLIIPLSSRTSGERFDKFSELSKAMKSGGSLALGQLNHHGRQTQAGLQPDPVSASNVRLTQNELKLTYNQPHPASEEEIEHILRSFTNGATYLEAAGFDGVQINAAHGYIFSQFLSKATNHRSDAWGGSLRNRARLLLEVVQRVRKACSSSLLLSVKLNCIEFETDGFNLQEARQVSQWLEEQAVDVIELSGGTYHEWGWKHASDSSIKREGYFVEAAEFIRPVLTKTKLYATGGFKTAAAMVNALKTMDGIGLGRALAQDPTLCRDILEKRVSGMRIQKLDQSSYALTALLAGVQMRAMGEGNQPPDGGDNATCEAVMNRLQSFMQERRADPFGERYGHMDVQELQPVPYATSM